MIGLSYERKNCFNEHAVTVMVSNFLIGITIQTNATKLFEIFFC